MSNVLPAAPLATPVVEYKEYAIFVPALGTTIAVTYDVGYFWGLDIKFFTLFSLTEHIVFALEALPIALAAAFVLCAFSVLTKLADKSGEMQAQRVIEKIKKNETTYQQWLRQSRRRDWVLIAAEIGLFAYGIYAIATGSFAVGTAIMCVAVYVVSDLLLKDMFSRAGVRQSFVSVSALLVTFSIGIQVQKHEVRTGSARHTFTLDDRDWSGLLIRSGDRGLLMFQPDTKKISFIRWEQIRRIDTETRP